jgi:dienelactone hydrolase
MRKFIKILVIILLFFAITIVGLLIWQPLAPPVQVAEPGATGLRIDEADIFANYYPSPNGNKGATILVLGGSEGGLGLSTKRTALVLQSEGFSVLQLAYHRAPHQPKNLELVPIEAFERALDWLKLQSNVDPEKIGVFGISKGAEAALLVSTIRPNDIKAVAAGAPSSVMWTGVNWSYGGASFKPSWSYGDEALPALRTGQYDHSLGILSLYVNGLKNLEAYPDTIISVERTSAPILLVCGEADTLWPSCPMSRQIQNRAEAKGGPLVNILAYENAGHSSVGTPIARGEIRYEKLGSLGGTAEGNAYARSDSWPKLVDFFRENLN